MDIMKKFSDLRRPEKKLDSNRLIFDLKLTAEISANLIKVKGPFTILTEVDHRVTVTLEID